MANINFIVVDDDTTDNYISNRIINKVLPEVPVAIFTDPLQAIEYIKKAYFKQYNFQTIVFVDISMEDMTGWDFMLQFEKLDNELKKQITVYILSNSDDAKDKQRAQEDKNIKGYIVKPLTEQLIRSIMDAL